MEDLRERILKATIEEFNEKSLKFTMDDIAKRLSISKKTIYTVFSNKEELFIGMVDYCFGAIKKSEEAIAKDETIDVLEKLKRIIIVLPEEYEKIDFRRLYELEKNFPSTYEKVKNRIESDWDLTILLLEQAMEEGRIRNISIPVFKMMVEGAIEHFLSRPALIEEGIPYGQALKEMIEILFEGISVKEVAKLERREGYGTNLLE